MSYLIINSGGDIMNKWHIKEMSNLTQVSIRMLRYYDKIRLLEPSFREPNGYRCYTEPDLTKLQQIIALKHFGFSLSQIKDILHKHSNIYAHLQAQQQVIHKQKEHLQNVHQLLGEILKDHTSSLRPDWKDMLLLIEGYKMNEKLREKLQGSWAGENLTATQFEGYLFFYEQFPDEFVLRDQIINNINQKKIGDPKGPDGERVACFMHDLQKKMKSVFTEQVKFGSSILKSIQSGQLSQLELNPEGMRWISEAIMTYTLNKWDTIYTEITDNMTTPPESEKGKDIAKKWRELIQEQLVAGNKDYLIGIMLWQEASRQNHEMKEQQTPSPQQMIKPWHVNILFNPQASAWLTQALELHKP
jgi:DNA-binding transcriptional MerR regulator